ncbi:MAG: hotdog domain-containing protein [Thermodesulfobacteriota bacterium]
MPGEIVRKSFQAGMFIEKKIETKPEMAASRFHRNSPQVLSSPSLVTLMQTTCADLMAPFLDSSEMVVSVRIEMNHFASAPIGSTILVKAEILKIEGDKVYFRIDAHDEFERIAAGFNDMYIINEERFEKGVKKKLDSLAGMRVRSA